MREVHISNRAEGYNFNKTSVKLIQTRRPVKAVFNLYPQGITHTNKELEGAREADFFFEISFGRYSWQFAINAKFSALMLCHIWRAANLMTPTFIITLLFIQYIKKTLDFQKRPLRIYKYLYKY